MADSEPKQKPQQQSSGEASMSSPTIDDNSHIPSIDLPVDAGADVPGTVFGHQAMCNRPQQLMKTKLNSW